jgi:hypothetical protein
MTTYTIAYNEMLLAIVPDGQDIDAAIAEEAEILGEEPCCYRIETGLTLTDERPEDESRIAWQGNHCTGWLVDEHKRVFDYAVRQEAS